MTRARTRVAAAAAGIAATGTAVLVGAVVAGALTRARRQRAGLRPGEPLSANHPEDRAGTPGKGGAAPARRDGGAVSVTGRMGRTLELARMGSRVGGAYVAGSARQVFASAARRESLAAERQLRTTAEVVETLGSMKGAFMKLGQMASYLDAGLDPAIRDQLAQLQADAPPMSPELAASVVESELGGSPQRIFATWDPSPIAAASIGQVHRAITRDGQAVAVKVQYPGVDEAIRADLRNTGTLLSVIRLAFPSLDAESLVVELRDRIGEELDYHTEARNQTMFAEHYDGHPYIHVPRVRPDLSSSRVLTSELVSGSRYDEAVGWSDRERDLAGETIFRFVFGGLYALNVFNGDPHPGNYLFHGGGRVTFLDFGLVKWFGQDDVDLLANMVQAAVTGPDPHRFRLAVEAAGFLRPGHDLDDEDIAAYFRHYYEPVLEDREVEFDEEYASGTLRHFFDASNPVVRRANVPPPFVVLQRINLGLYAILAGLRARANWRRIAEEVWPWVAAPPSTEIGRADAAWRTERGLGSGPLALRRDPTTPSRG